MTLPKNKQITLKRGESCRITLPDGRMLDVSSSGKIDLVAANGNTIVFDVPDIEHGETTIGVIGSVIQ